MGPLTNPFPGHNPFVEQRWDDFHTAFLIELRNHINPHLPSQLRARANREVCVSLETQEEEGGRTRVQRRIRPDVAILSHSARGQAVAEAEAGAVALATPVHLALPAELAEHRHAWVEIVEAGGGRVVTVLELLSPSNKIGSRDRELYLSKQSQCLSAGVNLVEVDLIRSGRPVTLARTQGQAATARWPLHACVWRASDLHGFDYFGFDLTQPLPTLPLPLREEDQELPLPLQAVYDQTFRLGRYDDLDYRQLIAVADAERPILERAKASAGA